MLGIIIWVVLIIVLAACIFPWWFIPSAIIYGLIVAFFKKY